MLVISLWGTTYIKPESIIYQEDDYFIAKLYKKVYLYFCRSGDKYYAFNKLSKVNYNLIRNIKLLLEGKIVADKAERFLTENSIKHLNQYE